MPQESRGCDSTGPSHCEQVCLSHSVKTNQCLFVSDGSDNNEPRARLLAQKRVVVSVAGMKMLSLLGFRKSKKEAINLVLPRLASYYDLTSIHETECSKAIVEPKLELMKKFM